MIVFLHIHKSFEMMVSIMSTFVKMLIPIYCTCSCLHFAFHNFILGKKSFGGNSRGDAANLIGNRQQVGKTGRGNPV